MTDIIAMAREAGFKPHHNPDLYDCMVASDEAIERFAALVRADERDRATRENAYVLAEREACAKVCDDWPNGRDDVYSIGVAIRARGQAS
jgi:hypothetical protein